MSDFDASDLPEQGEEAVMGGSGKDLKLAATLGRMVLGHFQNQRTLRQMEQAAGQERVRQDAVIAAPPTVHGSARWATPADVSRSGLLFGADRFDHPSSILLGAVPDPNKPGTQAAGWLHWDGEGHLLTVAPTRSGKSTTLIIPNLLRYKGSAVVLDPKGELYDATSAWRAANVGPVYRIAPFGEHTDGFNPLTAIRQPADARALADLMLPSDPNAQDFFKKDAVAFLTALILFLVHQAPPERRTLAELRRLTAASLDDFVGIARAMQASPVAAVANAANIVLGKSKDRGLPNLRDTLNTELVLWDDPGVIRATSSAEVDFRALKDRPATVYISVPFDKMEAFSPLLKVVLANALDAMIQNPKEPAIQVLFVLDEFLALGPFVKFLNAINTHASAGVRLWFFLQNLARLEEHYPTAWRNFFDASAKIFFGTRDPFTAKLVSEFLGDQTVAYRSASLSLTLSSSSSDFGMNHTAGHNASISSSVNLTGRALLTPAEVVSSLEPSLPDKSRQSIVFIPNTPPVLGRLNPYFQGTRCMQRHGALRLLP
ncbi:type IV secretory system conjugative DNA transfer family protein [Methylobacterium aquaticum]|uniref:type IV secretory system conjugative DNA transfer family protein n=1 Tax=Methylobacterium aquaticum TaxID=270351 RepID=UPI003D165F45